MNLMDLSIFRNTSTTERPSDDIVTFSFDQKTEPYELFGSDPVRAQSLFSQFLLA